MKKDILREARSWREDDQQSTAQERANETVTPVSGRTTPCCLRGESRSFEHEEYTVQEQTPPRILPLKERKRTEKKGVVSMSVEMMYQRCYIPTTKVGGFTGRFAKGNQSERESTLSTFLEDSCSSA